MMRLSMLACTACAILVAGCGGSSSTSSNASTTAPASSSAAASSTTSSASASSGPSSGITAQAVAICKQKISSNPSVPANLKPQLAHICDEAGSGNLAAVKKQTHDICIAVIKQKVPSAQQAAAEANCPAA